MTPDDGDLIRKTVRRDPQPFDELFNEYKASVYRFAAYLTQNRSDAEDLFQETWLRVIRYLPRTSNVRDFRAWILTITANLHRDALRKKRIRRLFFSHKTSGHDMNDGIGGAKSEKTDETNGLEMRFFINQAMANLPNRQRRVFVLKEIEGFKHSEIGEMLGLPVGTVKSLMHRAVKRLRRDLSDDTTT